MFFTEKLTQDALADLKISLQNPKNDGYWRNPAAFLVQIRTILFRMICYTQLHVQTPDEAKWDQYISIIFPSEWKLLIEGINDSVNSDDVQNLIPMFHVRKDLLELMLYATEEVHQDYFMEWEEIPLNDRFQMFNKLLVDFEKQLYGLFRDALRRA